MSENLYKFKINNKDFDVQIVAIDNSEAHVVVNGNPMKVDINSLPLKPSSNVEVKNHGPKKSPRLPVGMGMGAPVVMDAGTVPAQATGAEVPESAPTSGDKYTKVTRKTTAVFTPVNAPAAKTSDAKNPVLAPLPGLILSLKVKVGDSVNKGDVVLLMEAMKMENEIKAHSAGKITAIFTEEGHSVSEGDALVDIG